MQLALLYIFFALIATAANIGAQDGFVRLYSGSMSVELSILIGTGVGLVVKYVLDKRYIFRFQARNVAHDSEVFLLYMTMGVVTTLIFWSFELGFQYAFETKSLRYLGACIGLAIGYLAKYHLDKRFVFGKESIQ